MPLNFADALASVRKKAQLRGVPVSQQEVSGVAAGYSEQASSRLARIKALELEKQKHEETTAMQKSQFEQRMAQQREDREAAIKAGERESAVSGATTGALLGYSAIGGAAGGPVGAFIGYVGGKIASKCIIISSCTSKDSHEVEIAREFRDKYMSNLHLGGYYALAHKIAPLIDKSHFLKLIFKKFLVDRLVDYGEWILGRKPKRQLRTSTIITEGFLSLCALIGMQIEIQPYIEAHRQEDLHNET